jgi:hypothetical protein
MTTHGGAATSRLDAFGVAEGYEDASGKWRQAPSETCRAIVDAMGHPDAEPSVLVMRRGTTQRLSGPAEITLEDGAVLRIDAALPRDLTKSKAGPLLDAKALQILADWGSAELRITESA